MKCPKCGTEARDVARFCRRCHATLRYECPSCKHQQHQGGKCEKCGVDFLKYVTAIVAAQQPPADAEHERLEQRARLIHNLLLIPMTLGIPLLRDLFAASRKGRGF
jgi:hypothetical protein